MRLGPTTKTPVYPYPVLAMMMKQKPHARQITTVSDNLPLDRTLCVDSHTEVSLLTTRPYFTKTMTANHGPPRAYKQKLGTLGRMRFLLPNHKIPGQDRSSSLVYNTQNEIPIEPASNLESIPVSRAIRSSTSGSVSAATGNTAMRSANSSAPK